MPPVPFEQSGTIAQALWQLCANLFKRIHADRIPAQWQVTDIHLNVFSAPSKNGVRVDAHEDAGLRHLPQHRVEPVSPTTSLRSVLWRSLY